MISNFRSSPQPKGPVQQIPAEAVMDHSLPSTLVPEPEPILETPRETKAQRKARKKAEYIVWKDDQGKATDWALNALIYRIRKNPGFASSGYVIENHKKEGFVLYKD